MQNYKKNLVYSEAFPRGTPINVNKKRVCDKQKKHKTVAK